MLEAMEFFSVSISIQGDSDGVVLGVPSVDVYIQNDDSKFFRSITLEILQHRSKSVFTVVSVRFNANIYFAMESNGSVTVDLERVGDSDVSVEVLLTTVAGTAEGELLLCHFEGLCLSLLFLLANVDFEIVTFQEVVIIPSESFKMVSIPIINDEIREEMEQFTVQLSLPSGSTGVVLDQDSATVHIVDEDRELPLNSNTTAHGVVALY